MSKTDKRHTKCKDQPKGAGMRTPFRARAPFSREARFAQAMDGESGMSTGKCFKLVPLGDPVPGRAARGEVDPEPGRRAMKDNLVPGRLGQGPLIIDDEDDEGGKKVMGRCGRVSTATLGPKIGQRVGGRQGGVSGG